MTDLEMVELAAKAAGYEFRWGEVEQIGDDVVDCSDLAYIVDGASLVYWDPLEDDGDALRLAAKLKIDIEWQATNPFPEPRVEAYQRNDEGSYFCSDEHEDNYRRAIVRAAAEIGKAMP